MSRLLWQVLDDAWGDDLRLMTLLAPNEPPGPGPLPLSARLAFGARVASHQMTRACPWVFFAHPSLARVQNFVPPAWRKPYAVFLHGVEAWNAMSPAQLSVMQGATLRIANSRFTAARVLERHPTIGPIDECPLALTRTTDRSRSAGPLVDASPHTVVIVGRMSASERYKGHDQLIEAWPGVRAVVPEARLIVIGEGSDRARLERKAAALAPEAVTFTGFVPDAELDAWYRTATVLAMPSRGEGFGLAYLEAMEQGVPCVGSIHDAARDVIDDGVTGFLVDQADIGALTDRLVVLLTDDTRRRAMGEAGRQRATREFSRDRFAARLHALLARAFGARATAALARVPTGR